MGNSNGIFILFFFYFIYFCSFHDNNQLIGKCLKYIQIPFRDFILTNHGIVQDPQIEMYRERVKTIGFSILSQPGSFCLDIDWIKTMNTDSTEGNIILLQFI